MCRAGACSSLATASSAGCSPRCSSGVATRCSRSTPTRAGRAPDGPVDAAVVCAGAKTGTTLAEAALATVEPGGTVLLFADAGALPAEPVYRRELTVVGSRSATPEAMHVAASLLPELDLPEPLVLPLDRFADGLDLFLRREALKVVFVP